MDEGEGSSLPAAGYAGVAGIPTPALDWCFFFDFDGTLAHFAQHPEDVAVEHHLIGTLATLYEFLDGAVAIVSGRPIRQIDRFLSPLVLPAAGIHGLECRMPDGNIVQSPDRGRDLAEIKARLAAAIAGDDRLYLEDKEHTLALHFRRAPEMEGECRRIVDEALAEHSPDLQVLTGKMVLEIKPAHGNKGTAVEAFLTHPSFRGRLPCYAGDDVTDEDAFRVVNARNGISIRVGDDGATQAQYSVDGIDTFLEWLDAACRTLAAQKDSQSQGE